MNFLDGHLFPENQDKLVITAAPYGPEWIPSDFPEDIPVKMEDQIQKAVDCYNAGATVLHVHVREADGKGSKRLSKFNEFLARLRVAVPDMVLQVGGSISFAPESEGDKAKWLSDDTRHMLAELTPTPDQVTVTVNTAQMNIFEQMDPRDYAGTSLGEPTLHAAYREMISAIHSDFHLFKKLYGCLDVAEEAIGRMLVEMKLDGKTAYRDHGFTSRELSTGQRKRLAMIAALAEDRPLLVMDEWAADQDPEFRRYFYMEMLPALKARGKTVIAACHDDRYFHCADEIVTMEEGRIRPP